MSRSSFLDRMLRYVLKPFDLKPEEFTRRIGVIPTILASVFVRQTSRLYDYIGNQPGLGHFLNVGLWEDLEEDWEPGDTFTMTDRCRALVREVADRASIGSSTRLLDVGFGYGQQDRIFLEEYDCKEIVGINITASQVSKAEELLQEFVDQGRFLPHVGDAVKLPYSDASFDRVTAIESPFHFHTREDFLEEAYRVLNREGIMVATDIINGREKGEAPFSERLFSIAHDTYWQVDRDNYCTVEDYRESLLDVGFTNVRVQDVTERTLQPGISRYMRWRTSLHPPWLQALMQPVLKWGLNFYRSQYLRYVIVTAEKAK